MYCIFNKAYFDQSYKLSNTVKCQFYPSELDYFHFISEELILKGSRIQFGKTSCPAPTLMGNLSNIILRI